MRPVARNASPTRAAEWSVQKMTRGHLQRMRKAKKSRVLEAESKAHSLEAKAQAMEEQAPARCRVAREPQGLDEFEDEAPRYAHRTRYGSRMTLVSSSGSIIPVKKFLTTSDMKMMSMIRLKTSRLAASFLGWLS